MLIVVFSFNVAQFVFFIKYFAKLTKFDEFMTSKVFVVVLIVFFIIFVLAGFAVDIDIIADVGGSFMDGIVFYYINFLCFFALSYYYCYVLNALNINNKKLISMLGFLPTFFVSCFYFGLINQILILSVK
ncbi:hypothetical protein [Helicobacter turcicus]|uniref:Uncharacterized protein n=1 Tax=Helicobacter turcicus TaxID=2867412 RepID=A0ABS7JPB1_9HELI|nr:hypothetical protein [Helicobacter turcicus]MBX7491233.1 hypothetical protein [Helicobacter turcicus]MBX7546128.1 hypothetical protein [Helicobacter turcicus]